MVFVAVLNEEDKEGDWSPEEGLLTRPHDPWFPHTFLLLASLLVGRIRYPGLPPAAMMLASLPIADGQATEDCVVCGSDPITRCPCDCTANCETCPDWVGDHRPRSTVVWCAEQGIKSLSNAPIALPEGKVTLYVLVWLSQFHFVNRFVHLLSFLVFFS